MKEAIKINNETLNPNEALQGIVKISLIDKDNNAKEVCTKNAIMDITKYCQYLNLSEIGSGDHEFLNSYWDLSKLTNTINLYKLSDSYTVNSKNNLINYWDCSVIGTCGKKEVYSGNSTTKGSYNSTESKTYIDDKGNVVFHYVYDFPTHSANGTINAVGFAGSNIPAICGTMTNTVYGLSAINTDRSGRISNHLDYSPIYLYGITPTSTGFTLKMHTKFVNTLETVKEVTTKDTYGHQTYRFNTKSSNIVGILFKDKEHMIIQKFNLEGELMSDETIPMVTTNGGTIWIKAILDDNEDYLYIYDYTHIIVYDVKNNYNKIIEYSVLDEGETMQFNDMKYCTIHVDDNYIMITYLNNKGEKKRKYYNKQDFSLLSSAFRSDNSFYYSTPVTVNNNTTLVSNDYGYCFSTGHFVTTLTKLPSEIVKTNAQTMRITYDIVYTPISVKGFIGGQ